MKIGKLKQKSHRESLNIKIKSLYAKLNDFTIIVLMFFDYLSKGGVKVFYGYRKLPSTKEIAKGGIIKFQRLSEMYPNRLRGYNILYMVSSHYPPQAEYIKKASKRKGARFVWNQDGVAYPAWMPTGWEIVNAKLAAFLHDADYVFYQSEFAKESADNFLGKVKSKHEVLYNPVDTQLFHPENKKIDLHSIVILSAGSKYKFDRIEIPLRCLSFVHQQYPHARLRFAGHISPELRIPTQKLISELKLEHHVSFLPPFSQKAAPEIFRKCDMLLHPKINDPCPGVVIEAMACGLPIVYSDSGGVPELVGSTAGVGVATEANWDSFEHAKPKDWAGAVLSVFDSYLEFSESARQRAVERFDLRPWIARHRQIFNELLDRGKNRVGNL